MFTELCLSLCANVLDVLLAEDHHSLILLHASVPPCRQVAERGCFGLCQSQKLKVCLKRSPIPSRTLPGMAPPASVRYRREARAAVRIRRD